MSRIESICVCLKAYVEDVRVDLESRWKRWPIDVSELEFREVSTALIARQITLIREMAESPLIWNGNIAPAILRVMADVHINLAWILQDPIARSRKFIRHGLGQMKLELEHQRTVLSRQEGPDEVARILQARQEWLDSQRWSFLTDVNLGSWAGINAREMATEAECTDFYNQVYQPYSACVHSMWHFVGRFNLRECHNPLHRNHRVPRDNEFPIDPSYPQFGAAFVDLSLRKFDEHVKLDAPPSVSYETLCRKLNEVSPPGARDED